MRKILLLFCAVLLVSCAHYQYVTLNSAIYKADNQSFVWENDSVKVQYIFSGADCPITVKVHNKLAQPIYVDWEKSAVIYSDGSRFSLWNDETHINLATTGGAVNFRSDTFTRLETSGGMKKQEQVSFIPPNSYVSVTPMAVRSTFISPLPQNLKQRVPFGNTEGSKVDKYVFSLDNSPFTFRCFLTLSTSEDFEHPILSKQPLLILRSFRQTIYFMLGEQLL